MASKRAVRRRACQGKEAHETYEKANGIACYFRRMGEHMRAYRCKFCGHYHIGHYGGV